jgi:endothelin-converting enzyme/putative endopeptidase
VDKTEWYMSPQTVNAYYNPSYNEIVFQQPFCNRLYNYQADEGKLWRNRGAVIGHEISWFYDSGAWIQGWKFTWTWWMPMMKQFLLLGLHC